MSLLKLGLEWEWKIFSCQLYSNISRSNVFAEWMSMALVASSRCYSIVQPIKSRKFFSKRNLCIIVILNKIYGFVLLIPFNFGVSDFFSDFFKKFFTLSKNRKFTVYYFSKNFISLFFQKKILGEFDVNENGSCIYNAKYSQENNMLGGDIFVLLYIFAFFLTGIIIFGSYGYIFYYTKNSNKYLKRRCTRY